MNSPAVARRIPGTPTRVIPALLLAGMAALAVDVPLSRFCHVEHGARFAHNFLEHLEPFGQPAGVVVICGALLLCDATRGRQAVRIALAAIGSGLAADVVKLLVARARPYHFFTLPGEGVQETVLNSFRGLLPFLSGGSRLQSCPSAHTAFVTGFCLGLWATYPKGRWLFLLVAVLVALQRIEGGAHFLSDTLWGAAVGYLFCLWLYAPSLPRLTAWEASPPPSPYTPGEPHPPSA